MAWRGGSLRGVPALVRDPMPVEVAALIDQRRRLGQDLFDEVWEGVLHMNPAPSGRHGMIESQVSLVLAALARAAGLTSTGQFNLGEENDYRVPDAGLHRDWSDRVFYATAALVLEIVSPGDESWNKLPFYAEQNVGEVLIIDPAKRGVDWLGLTSGGYRPAAQSALIELGPVELDAKLDWPAG